MIVFSEGLLLLSLVFFLFCGYMNSVSQEKRQRSVASAAVCKPKAIMHAVVTCTVHLLKAPQFILRVTCIFADATAPAKRALQPIDPPFSCDNPTAAPLSSPPLLQPFPLVQQLLQPSRCFLCLRTLHLHEERAARSVPTITAPACPLARTIPRKLCTSTNCLSS